MLNPTDRKDTIRVGDEVVEVIFAADTPNSAFKAENKRCIWIKSKHGVVTPMPIELAVEYYNKPGRKFDFAKEEDIPFIPQEKLYPYDPEHKPAARDRVNIEMTGKEVEALANEGKNPQGDGPSMQELRAMAKENEINSKGMKKLEIKKALEEKGVL